jgi:hypothetical protein|tara:strand:+ start:680 stop:793 length:114 start_codon:yes stop_codon:yes gene_type:complete
MAGGEAAIPQELVGVRVEIWHSSKEERRLKYRATKDE